jgi:hypothetical protein
MLTFLRATLKPSGRRRLEGVDLVINYVFFIFVFVFVFVFDSSRGKSHEQGNIGIKSLEDPGQNAITKVMAAMGAPIQGYLDRHPRTIALGVVSQRRRRCGRTAPRLAAAVAAGATRNSPAIVER